MRTSLMDQFLRNAVGAALLLSGFGLASPALADDVCVGDECTDVCDVDDVCDDLCDGGCDTCSWCNLGDPWTIQGYLHDDPCEEPFMTIGGWTQFGITSRSTGQFNDIDRNFNLHQQWFYAERVADGSKGLDFGFRSDIMYGIDAGDTQAFGGSPRTWDFQNGLDHGIYGWAFPQLYGEVAMGDLSVKVGHFYTLIGYEVVTAPDNFFYSHAYTMYNNEPFTHTGALATYTVSDETTVYLGWVDGWDTGFEFSGGSQIIGGVSQAVSDSTTVTYIFLAGERERNATGEVGDGYNHSIVVDTALTDDLNYVFQTDWSDYGDADIHNFAINQYLFYTVNDCLAFGGRFEWYHVNNDVAAGPGSADLYEVTLGMNVRPHANVIMRPEVRWDWDQEGIVNGNDGVATFGFDTIVTY